MADGKVKKALERDGIKPLRIEIPDELQPGNHGLTATVLRWGFKWVFYLDASYGELEDYLKDMQKIIHEQKESYSCNLRVKS